MILHPTPAPHALTPLIVAGCGEFILAGAEWIFGALVQIGSSIGSAFQAFFSALAPLFEDIWGAIAPIWYDVLKPFLVTMQQWLVQLYDWWKTWSQWVSKVISAIAKVERAIYVATFGPVLDTISELQKIITLLHLNSTALGQAVDKALGEVEQHLNAVYQALVGPINKITSIIDGYILDANFLLSHDLLIGSFAAHFVDIWKTWWTQSLPALTAAGQKALTTFGQVRHLADSRSDLSAFATYGGGPLQPMATASAKVFADVLAGQDPPPPQPPA